MSWLTRWRYRIAMFLAGDEALNRRAQVEEYLLRAAAGKHPLPDAAKCRELAHKLGVPSRYWSLSGPLKRSGA